jgi:hypothetical protein
MLNEKWISPVARSMYRSQIEAAAIGVASARFIRHRMAFPVS